jgi:hypothetical protein
MMVALIYPPARTVRVAPSWSAGTSPFSRQWFTCSKSGSATPQHLIILQQEWVSNTSTPYHPAARVGQQHLNTLSSCSKSGSTTARVSIANTHADAWMLMISVVAAVLKSQCTAIGCPCSAGQSPCNASGCTRISLQCQWGACSVTCIDHHWHLILTEIIARQCVPEIEGQGVKLTAVRLDEVTRLVRLVIPCRCECPTCTSHGSSKRIFKSVAPLESNVSSSI